MIRSYSTLRELISRLEGNDKKVCNLALDCLIIQDKQIKELRAEVKKLRSSLEPFACKKDNCLCEMSDFQPDKCYHKQAAIILGKEQ